MAQRFESVAEYNLAFPDSPFPGRDEFAGWRCIYSGGLTDDDDLELEVNFLPGGRAAPVDTMGHVTASPVQGGYVSVEIEGITRWQADKLLLTLKRRPLNLAELRKVIAESA